MNITYAPMESHLEIKILLCDKDKLQRKPQIYEGEINRKQKITLLQRFTSIIYSVKYVIK